MVKGRFQGGVEIVSVEYSCEWVMKRHCIELFLQSEHLLAVIFQSVREIHSQKKADGEKNSVAEQIKSGTVQDGNIAVNQTSKQDSVYDGCVNIA